MPLTERGLYKMLDFFIDAIIRAAESLGNPDLFLRKMEEEGLRKFMASNLPEFHATQDPAETCRLYSAALDSAGMVDTSDTAIREDGRAVRIEIGPRCVYRSTCTRRHDEGSRVYCVRAYALAEMLRIRLEKDYEPKLEAFGLPCRIRLKPTEWG